MSVPSILDKLKQINNSNLVSAYVPSLQKKMDFRPLSIKQQKDLIKSSMDRNLSGITFSNILNQIIVDNSIQKSEYLVTDRYPIIVALRKQAFGGLYDVVEEEKKKTFDLGVILERELTYSEPKMVEIMLKDTELTVRLEVISLENDIKINNYQLDKLKKDKTEDISETVGSLFVYEILKFVSKVIIGKEEVDMVNLPVKDRLSIIESLPVTMNNLILEYIQNLRKDENEYITIDGELLPLDPRFFSKES